MFTVRPRCLFDDMRFCMARRYGKWTAEDCDMRLGEPYAAGAGAPCGPRYHGAPAVLKLCTRIASPSTRPRRSRAGTATARFGCSPVDGGHCCWSAANTGEPLQRLGGEAALDVLVGLLPRLWVPAGAPFRP